MWALTGFADEVSKDFGEQLDLMTKLGIRHIEMRSAWGTKVLDLSADQRAKAKSMLADAGIKLSAVGSDLGKIQIDDDFAPHLERTKHGMDVAHEFGCTNMRTFSFFMPEDLDPDEYYKHRDVVLDRLGQMVAVAKDAGVMLLHENEKDIYGDVPERCVDLIQSLGSDNLGLTFDPANYVQCGIRPADEALPQVREWTRYVHIKDAKSSDNSVVPAGEGDGQVKEVLDSLRNTGYDGFLSVEPHLGDFDAFGGLCGPDLWTDAYNALTSILRELGIEWR
ncbi:MAG TPA: sugar phosphate isomerase/epimerase family protein [Actinomycetaceae bacterium]|nr:sugar phosphate isomerase/epimerase family protein [Actinomycetaceae bacterium]